MIENRTPPEAGAEGASTARRELVEAGGPARRRRPSRQRRHEPQRRGPPPGRARSGLRPAVAEALSRPAGGRGSAARAGDRHLEERVRLVLAEGQPLLRADHRDRARARSPCSNLAVPGGQTLSTGVHGDLRGRRVVHVHDPRRATCSRPGSPSAPTSTTRRRSSRSRCCCAPTTRSTRSRWRSVGHRAGERLLAGDPAQPRRPLRCRRDGHARADLRRPEAPVEERQEHPPQRGDPLDVLDRDASAALVPAHAGGVTAGRELPPGRAARSPPMAHDACMKPDAPDAIVVGSGPNGLAAAITLARAGKSVVVYEAHDTVGGGMRSAELTLPGFVHDICSTVQGTSTASPFFRDLDLGRFGLELIDPPAPLAHVLDGGRVAVLERSVAETAAGLGADGAAYRRLMGPLVRDADALMDLVARPDLPRPAPPAGRRPLRAAGAPLGGRPRPSQVRRRGGPRAPCRGQRPLDAAARAAPHRLVRAGPGHHRPRLRLADRARRNPAARRRPRRRAAIPGRGDRDGPPRDLDLRAPGGPGGALRHDAAGTGRDRGRASAGRVSAPPRRVPLRPGSRQGRLGAERAHPVGGRGGSSGRDGPRRGHARRDPGGRSGGRGRAAPGAAVRHRRPAEPLRPEPRARRAPHGLGLLPRARAARPST